MFFLRRNFVSDLLCTLKPKSLKASNSKPKNLTSVLKTSFLPALSRAPYKLKLNLRGITCLRFSECRPILSQMTVTFNCL